MSDETNDIETVDEKPTELSPGPRRLTKLDLKRMQLHEQQRLRLVNQGIPEDKVDETIAREAYERMPTEEKLKRLHNAWNASFQQLALEMQNLRHNDQILADAMDVNFRAIAKMLVELGMPMDKQGVFLAQAREDMQAEITAREAAMEAAQKAKQKKSVADTVNQAGEQPQPPEEATTFGDS